jgi:hypothetical protein
MHGALNLGNCVHMSIESQQMFEMRLLPTFKIP